MAASQPSDRISGLPDEILLKILSILPDSRLAFQTSVLSTRWRHLPSHCPVIRLPCQDGDRPTTTYLRIVDGCLGALRAPTLHYLQIEIPNHPNAAAAVDQWIRFAGDRCLRELHLSNVSYSLVSCFLDYGTRIPSSLFSSSLARSLTSLHVNDCPLNHLPGSFQGFSLLRELTISKSWVDDRNLSQLLRYCTVLETLQLIRLSNCEVLRLDPVMIPKLKHLRIVKFRCGKAIAIVIEAPSLRSLSLEGCFEDIILNDCRLLTDVKIYGYLLDHVNYHSDISLLSSVSMVDRMSVDDWFFQVEFVRKHAPDNSVPVFMNLKKLCCDVDCVTDHVLGVFPSILEECPSLIELHVKIKGHEKELQSDLQSKEMVEYCRSQQSWLKTSSELTSIELSSYVVLEQDGRGSSELIKGTRRLSHQLKYAVVQGFLGAKSEARLLQLLLRHATSLEKLVVIGFDFQFYDQTMVQKLLSHFRKECPQVQILQKFQKL